MCWYRAAIAGDVPAVPVGARNEWPADLAGEHPVALDPELPRGAALTVLLGRVLAMSKLVYWPEGVPKERAQVKSPLRMG